MTPRTSPNLLQALLGAGALLMFAGDAAHAESPAATSSSFSDAACQVCEVQYERCAPQLQLGACVGRYVQCLQENHCEPDAAHDTRYDAPPTEPDVMLQMDALTD